MENHGSTRRDSVEIVQVVSHVVFSPSLQQSQREKATKFVLEQEIMNENIDFLKQNEELFKVLEIQEKNNLLFSAFCHINNAQIVKFLIEIVGANVCTLLETEVTFLQEREEMLKDLEIKFKNQLLLEACYHPDIEKVKYLIEIGAEINCTELQVQNGENLFETQLVEGRVQTNFYELTYSFSCVFPTCSILKIPTWHY